MPAADPLRSAPATQGLLDAEHDQVYGLLRIAGTDVAIALSALREVVPCPPELAALPVNAEGLLGAIELRSLVVPVLDLRPLLGTPSQRTPEQVVVVTTHDEHVVGVLTDAVRGITRVPSADLLSLRASPAGGLPLLLRHAFRDPGTGSSGGSAAPAAGRIVSVLDPATLLSLPGLPAVADSAASPGASSGSAASGTSVPDPSDLAGADDRPQTRTLTVLRCDGQLLALDAEHVHTLLPPTAPTGSVISSTLCEGVTGFAEQEVAVVDPLVLLGIGQRGAPGGSGLVLDLGHGYVVLDVGTLVDLVEVPARKILPLPALTTSHGALLGGIVDLHGVGQCLVMDGHALRRHPELVSLASLNTPTAGSAAGPASSQRHRSGTGPQDDPRPQYDTEEPVSAARKNSTPTAGAGKPYLRYSLGIDIVTALEQIVEILPLPTTLTATGAGDPALLGVVVHRHAPLPVLCLRTLLELTPAPTVTLAATSCVLVVHIDDQPVAFAVDALRSIAPLTWQDQESTADSTGADGGQWLRRSRLIEVGDTGQLLPDLDLHALARHLTAPEHGQHSPAPETAPPEAAVRETAVPDAAAPERPPATGRPDEAAAA